MSLNELVKDMDKSTRSAILLLDRRINDSKMECLTAIRPTTPYNDSIIKTQLNSIEQRMKNINDKFNQETTLRLGLNKMDERLNVSLLFLNKMKLRMTGFELFVQKFFSIYATHHLDVTTKEDAKGLLKLMGTDKDGEVAAEGESAATIVEDLTKKVQEQEREIDQLHDIINHFSVIEARITKLEEART